MEIGDVGTFSDGIGVALQAADQRHFPVGEHAAVAVHRDGDLSPDDTVQLGVPVKVVIKAVAVIPFRDEAVLCVAQLLILQLIFLFIRQPPFFHHCRSLSFLS